MSDPTRSASPLRATFQGERGAYSEQALRAFFGGDVEPVACRTFDAVAQRVVDGSAGFGILPVENSLAGTVVGSYDALAAHPLEVVGEVIAPIHHAVLARPGATVEELRRLLSHPVALAQCTRFFAEHPHLEAVAHYDTAGAARAVAESDDPTVGAIAGVVAAEAYGLAVLRTGIEDHPSNQTRFLVVTRRDGGPARSAEDGRDRPFRTSLLAETANAPGALVRLLQCFAERGINLCKLESRPAAEPWSYRFFIELDAGTRDPQVEEAIEAARGAASALRVLGSYPRWRP